MEAISFRYPEAIVSCDWLGKHLDDPNLRIFDCTTHLHLEEGTNRPYRVESGLQDYNNGHIPNSVYLDLQKDFSLHESPYSFTVPSAKEIATSFEHHGVGDESHVVLYSRTTLPWATRVWWMLRWIGFDNAAILDGGYGKWVSDGRMTSTESVIYPDGKLTVRERTGLFVGKNDVLAATGDSGMCVISALGPDLFSGETVRYGRPGRIPGSINVPAASHVAPETMELLLPEAIAKSFKKAGAVPEKRAITYCGGGIFATLDAFLLHQLGFENVAVYDNSMSEWGTDPALPMETG